MVEHWKVNGPPVYIAVALYLGLTGKKNSSKATKISEVDADENAKNLMSLVSDLAGTGGVFHG